MAAHEFCVAFKSFHTSRVLTRELGDSIVVMWGALEQLFSRKDSELSFRVSAVIAAYMEPVGPARLAMFKHVRQLYNQRSRAAHGGTANERASLEDTFFLLRRALMQMIEKRDVPSIDDLERNVFDNHLWA
jgi:hypothetical protein